MRSLPFRVGQHIVCIDGGLAPTANTNSWSEALPPNPQDERSDAYLKKDKMFAMRMTTADYDRIQNKSIQAGMTMTDFLTQSALDKKIIVVDGLDGVTAQLKAIGKNLNQLTVLRNMGKISCPDLTEIKKGFGTVFEQLYTLMDKGA